MCKKINLALMIVAFAISTTAILIKPDSADYVFKTLSVLVAGALIKYIFSYGHKSSCPCCTKKEG